LGSIIQLHGSGKTFVVDPKTDAVTATFDTCKGGGLGSMTPDARKVYLSCAGEGQTDVVVLDLAGGAPPKHIATGNRPKHGLVSPDGRLVGVDHWALADGKLRVAFIDTAKDEVVKPGIVVYDLTQAAMPEVARMDMPLIGEEVVEAHHGNFTQDGRLFMALNRGPGKDSRGREVAFFDPTTKALVHRLTTASNGVGHTYNGPDGKYAVATNYGNNVIALIDLAGLKTVKDLKIGKGRMGHIAFTQDGKWGYVSNAGDGNLWKIDMGRLEVVKEIATGKGQAGGAQVLNVWTNVFEELPRRPL
jgi:DNA-binding beta-propeller fold protein YncE